MNSNFPKILLLLIFFLLMQHGQAQDYRFRNVDKIPNCKMMRAGKFLSFTSSEKNYFMLMMDSVQYEYVNNGKEYIKSKMYWISDCEYISITIENKSKLDYFTIGDTVFTKIDETQEDKIKLTAKYKGKSATGFYQKVDDIPTTNQTTIDDPDSLINHNAYKNPLNGITYKTDCSYKSYIEPVKNTTPVTGLAKIIFLDPYEDILKSVDAHELAKLIKKARKVFSKSFDKYNKSGKIIVQFMLLTDADAVIEVGANGEIEKEKSNKFLSDLEKIKSIRSKEYVITFQLLFYVNSI